DSELHDSTLRESGHNRLGPGPRLARQHLTAQTAAIRPLLHHALDALARPADSVDDAVARDRAPERLLNSPKSVVTRLAKSFLAARLARLCGDRFRNAMMSFSLFWPRADH